MRWVLLTRHWGHAPNSIREVVGNDERAPRVDGHSDRSTTSLAVLSHKALHEVHRRTSWSPVIKWDEHYLVTGRRLPIPTSMLANEYAVGELGPHAREEKDTPSAATCEPKL